MTAQATDTAVQTSIIVDAPQEKAFRFFTDDIGKWWPPEHHILDGELAADPLTSALYVLAVVGGSIRRLRPPNRGAVRSGGRR